MILNSQAVKGLPVICGSNGKRIGTVADIRYTPGKKTIDGIMVADHQWMSGAVYISWDKISTFGEAAVIVNQDYNVGERQDEKPRSVLGRTVIRDDGWEVGTISDILFNPVNGQVEGYEISKGFIDDLLNGRNMLPGNTLSNINGDVIVISVEQSDDIKSNQAGIKNIFLQ